MKPKSQKVSIITFVFLVIVCVLPQRVITSGDKKNIKIFGYGDLHYNSPGGSDFPDRRTTDLADAHRLVIGLGWKPKEKWKIEAEIDFEHAAQSLELEELEIEYEHSDFFELKAGVLEVPIGPLNANHAPTMYYSVERPYLDRLIIPSTWSELAAGAVFRWKQPWKTKFTVLVVSGLNASRFSADQGIRGGRESAAAANSSGASGIIQLQTWPRKNLLVGSSFYFGSAGIRQGNTDIASSNVLLREGHINWEPWIFDLTARYTQLDIGNAGMISTNKQTLNGPVAKQSVGFLLEGGIRFGQYIFQDDKTDIVGFVRFEGIDTQNKVPAGFVRQSRYDRKIISGGFAFYPFETMTLKADVEHWKIATGAGENRYNMGIAFTY